MSNSNRGKPGAKPTPEQIEQMIPRAVRALKLGIPETEAEVSAFEAELDPDLGGPLPPGLLEAPLPRSAEALDPAPPASDRSERASDAESGAAISALESVQPPPLRVLKAPRPGLLRSVALVAGAVAVAAGMGFWVGARRSAESSLRVLVTSERASEIRDLRVVLDGAERCFDTSCVIPNLSPGSHKLTLRATGFETYSRTLEVRPGVESLLDVQLERTGSARVAGTPIAFSLRSECVQNKDSAARCCYGSACTAGGGKACSSGRKCVPCELAEPGLERWRLRAGGLWLTPRMELALRRASPGAQRDALSVCVSLGRAGRRTCRPANGSGALAHNPAVATPMSSTAESGNPPALGSGALPPSSGTESNGPESGSENMLLVSSLELLAGLGVDVVSNDDGVLLGSWSRPIRITPGVLCSGVLAKPSSKDGLEIGAVSLFFDDAYYVETAASGVLDEVERSASSLRPTGVGVSLFETVRASEGRFLLALGPLSFKEAQRVRWSLLETGATARVSLGEDFVQPGLPLQR